MEWKYTYLKGTKFVWHLDDNPEEFSHAKHNGCNVPMIQVNANGWEEKCERIIRIKHGEMIANIQEEADETDRV
jgi:hypothetical protein